MTDTIKCGRTIWELEVGDQVMDNGASLQFIKPKFKKARGVVPPKVSSAQFKAFKELEGVFLNHRLSIKPVYIWQYGEVPPVVVDIRSRIRKERADFVRRKGVEPKSVYLGRNEMKQLLVWAEDNDYLSKGLEHDIEGCNRPEVDGLLCYEVNDSDHLELS